MGDNIEDYGSIVTDKSSNLYVTGSFDNSIIQIGPYTLHNSSFNNDEVFLAKYDSSGNEIWAKSFGGVLGDDGMGLVYGKDNKLYLTGQFSSPTITFGSTTLTYHTTIPVGDFFLTKLDTSGAVIWAKSSVGSAIPYCITIDNDNNIYTGGEVYDTAYVAFSMDTLRNSCLEWGGFLTKYDTSGTVVWVKGLFNKTSSVTTGGIGNKLYGLTTDPCNNVWVSGHMSGDTVGIVIDSGVILHLPTGSYDPMYFIGFNSSGLLLQYLALISGGDDYSELASDNFGNIYLSADTWTTLYLGGDTVVPQGESLLLAKYNPNLNCRNSSDTTLGGHPLSLNSYIDIYPNPTTRTLIIRSPSGITTVAISNLLGQVVYSQQYNSPQVQVDVSTLPAGVYFLKVNGTEVRKFIKQ